MEVVANMFWEIGPVLANASWKRGEGLKSPVIKTSNGVSWWLDFYPVGDDDNPDNLVFWLNRSNADKHVEVVFEIQLCFYSTPVRHYALQHAFEKGEDVHKWIIVDVKNLSQLKIFIPPSTLCLIGYLTVHDQDEKQNTLQSSGKYQTFPLEV